MNMIEIRNLAFVIVLAVMALLWWMGFVHAQIQPGPNLSPQGIPFLFAPRAGYLGPPIGVHNGFRAPGPLFYPRTGRWSIPVPGGPMPLPPPGVMTPPRFSPSFLEDGCEGDGNRSPECLPLGWVFTRYTVCPQPRDCPIVFVSVGADGLNVRTVPDGPPIMALVNGTPLVVLT